MRTDVEQPRDDQLSAKALEERPVTICVLGLFLAVLLSHLAQLDFVKLADSGYFYFKIVVYYVLFVGLVAGWLHDELGIEVYEFGQHGIGCGRQHPKLRPEWKVPLPVTATPAR